VSDAQSEPSRDATWSVWRTDDTGNTFLVRGGLTQEEAQRLVEEFEARGHKQMYFAERESMWGESR